MVECYEWFVWTFKQHLILTIVIKMIAKSDDDVNNDIGIISYDDDDNGVC